MNLIILNVRNNVLLPPQYLCFIQHYCFDVVLLLIPLFEVIAAIVSIMSFLVFLADSVHYRLSIGVATM